MSYDYEFKMIMLGDSNVGKTSIAKQFSDNMFDGSYKATVGVEFCRRSISVDGKNIQIHLWDTAGEEKSWSISKSYFKGSIGAILVYDIASLKSFSNVPKWLELLRAEANKDQIFYLVGNKSDLETQRQVSTEDARSLAKKEGMEFFECSAKENKNVEDIFSGLSQEINSKINKKEIFPIAENYGIKLGKQPAKEGQAGEVASARKCAC